MELVREKEFVNQYHYDARNLEWEKENGTPKTNFEVTFQLVKKDTDNNQNNNRFCFTIYDCKNKSLSLVVLSHKWFTFKIVLLMNQVNSLRTKLNIWQRLYLILCNA